MNNEAELWLLGADNLFAKLGWPAYLIEWMDSLLLAFLIALPFFLLGMTLRFCLWVYRAITSTRQTSP